jgi:hypothetical protein
VFSVFNTVGEVAAVAIDCAVVVQDACAEFANSIGKNAADSATNNAANERSAFILVSLP